MSAQRSKLAQAIGATRENWDHDRTPDHVRRNLAKVAACGTLELGAEVFASDLEKRIVPHTCKSRMCPSCGVRATIEWQRRCWHDLPDVRYIGITLTMPDTLWPSVHQHRSFRRHLAALGALAIQRWFWARYRLRPIVLVIRHTFGGKLNFHPHLHLLVSLGGLRRGSPRWNSVERIDGQEVMELWRFAVTEYVSRGCKPANQTSRCKVWRIPSWIAIERARRWNIHLSASMSKERFLGYAGRYIRRPPITETRILSVANGIVNFAGKNTRRRTIEEISLPVEQFVQVLSQHAPEHYEHSMRYFGLLSPRGIRVAHMPVSSQPQTGNLLRRARNRLPWAVAIQKCFGVNPLMDRSGQPLTWQYRISPQPIQR